MFKCSKCTREFATHQSLQRHSKLSDCKKAKKVYKCIQCSTEFDKLSRLKRHETKHEKTVYDCWHCGKHYIRPDKYQNHLSSEQHKEQVSTKFILKTPSGLSMRAYLFYYLKMTKLLKKLLKCH